MTDLTTPGDLVGRSLDGATTGPRTDDRADGGMVNYYDVLNLEPGASRLEIREMYLRMKATYSVGSAALYSLISEDEARETMSRVEEAFRVLNDDIQRREYDKSLGFVTNDGSLSNVMDDFSRGHGFCSEATLQAERLAKLRGLEPDPPRKHTPSRLPTVHLKAKNAGSESLKEAYETIIADCDPGDGDLYRRLREAAGVGEEEMQERTKVCRGYIHDLEENRFDRLPPLVYVKGFLRSMLKYLGVPDAERLVTAYASRLSEWQATRKS